jgi:hypothetical protein
MLLYSLHMQAAIANKKAPAADSAAFRSDSLAGLSHPDHIIEDEDGKEVFRATPKKKKQRFYLNASSRQFDYSQRILYPENRQAYYIQEKENKSGVYQWHDAFLPAYYNFLFRYTLF